MRPTPQEVIDHVRRVLKDVVAPELTNDHARQRVAEVRAVLAQTDWNGAGLRLAAETGELREVLTQLRTQGITSDLTDAALAEPLGSTFDEVREQHELCAAAVVALLAELERRAYDDGPVAEARARLLATLT